MLVFFYFSWKSRKYQADSLLFFIVGSAILASARRSYCYGHVFHDAGEVYEPNGDLLIAINL